MEDVNNGDVSVDVSLTDVIEPIISSLISRNITIFDRRTSIRLEPEMWEALNSIADREGCTIHDLCSLIHIRKREGTSLTAAIRVFLMLYFRAASSEAGHVVAGHGSFANMKARARISSEYDAFFQSKRRSKRHISNTHARTSAA